METFTLLLVFLTVSGSSSVLHPRRTVMEVDVSERKSEHQRDESSMKGEGDERNGILQGILKVSVDEDGQKREEEEKESNLVAGISLDQQKGSEGRGREAEDRRNAKHEGSVEREKQDRHAAISKVTPPLNPIQLWEAPEIPTIITQSPNPPSSRGHVVSASEGPASPGPPGEERSHLSTPAEGLKQPGHNLRQLRGSQEANGATRPETLTFPSTVQTVESTTQPLRAEEAVFTGPSGGSKAVEQELRRNEASPPQLQQRKAQNRGGKSVKVSESKEKRKTKTPKRKEDTPPTHFPYFQDDYCPPECACYGRVVQCSDKGIDKVPYGIPYNTRYVLLMNNHIDSIQLDLLSEYVSMEFLVLSNNRLTDGHIEGAFEGIPALKRLYLERNLLRSTPTDLPRSLEELRLDGNQLSVMSEASWARCPGLLLLSLSNNSLGNGSHLLPSAVFSPLSKLRTLNLDHNQLASVPLDLPLSIKELYLKGNMIERFHGGAFNGISQLMVLDLSSNQLTNRGLLSNSLLNSTSLESLNLARNKLKHIPQNLPRSLKTLSLEGNLITSIKKGSLSALKNLEHLGLARNKISRVAPGAFKILPVLHQLDLCHNTLRQVPRELPRALNSVALTHNRIDSVPHDAFCWGDKSLSRLVRVQLQDNLIDMGKLNVQAFRCLRGFQVVHFY